MKFVVNQDPLKRLNDLKEKYLNQEVFHEVYKSGKVIDVFGTGAIYLKVQFSEETKTFSYPSCFDNEFLTLGKPKSFDEMSYHEKEVIKEKEKFNKCVEICKNHIKNDEVVEDDSMSYDMYDLDYEKFEKINSFKNTGIKENYINTYNKILKEPFFGSFMTEKDGLVYVAKKELDGETLKWTNPICATYYNYTYLSNDEQLGLKLVRDHQIIDSRYKNFVDKFNILSSENNDNFGFNLETTIDKNLVMVIENERKSKKTHEIIATIQNTQYEIISDTESKNIVVSGVAGSGKTMVLFHRIAYLAFNEKDYVPQRHIVLSASKLLNREANVLAKELEISQIYNLDTKTFYSSLVKQYINSSKSTYVFDDVSNQNSDNSDVYTSEFLENIGKKAISIAKKESDYEDYSNYKFNLILSKIKSIYPNFIERDFEQQDFFDSYFLMDNESYNKQNLAKEILHKIRLYNLDYMYENSKLSANQARIYEFVRDNLNVYLNQEPIYDFENEDFMNFINFYFSLAENPKMATNKVLLDTFTGKNVLSYDVVVFTSDYLMIRNFLNEISFYISSILFEKQPRDLNKEELMSYRFIKNTFEPYIEHFKQYSRHSDVKIALFSLKNKVNVTGYAVTATTNVNMAKAYAIYVDYLANKDICDKLINLISKVSYEQLSEYKTTHHIALYQQLIDLLGSRFNAKPAYLCDFTAIYSLEDLLKNEKKKKSCFEEFESYETLINIYDRRIFNHTFIKELGLLKKTIIEKVKGNRNFKYNQDAREFLTTYLGEYFDRTSYGENPEKYLSSDQSLNYESSELDTLVSLIAMDVKKTSCYNSSIKSVSGLIDLFDYTKLKKDIFQFVKFKENGNFEEIFYILEYLLSDVKLSIQDKAFIFVYVLKDFYETTYDFERIFIDEFQNYSVEEIKLLKRIFKTAKLELYGDYKQKICDKGINSLSDIDFIDVKQYELKVNYRNSFEICQYLINKFHMNMIGVGIQGSAKEVSMNEEISITHSDDRTVLIVKDYSIVEKLRFSDKAKQKFINPNVDYIERNVINILKVEDTKGLEFEKVYVVEDGMNENEKYIACTRALNDLVVMK